MKEMSDKKKLTVNILATITIFVVNALISFFLSPFIVRTLGVEANGFIQLAANFASYISIVTVAINSMSGRFITIAIARGETEKAASYYTSVLWANIFLFVVLLIPIIIFILKLDSLINIPAELLTDVKLLFCFAFANLMLSNLLSLWNNTFYALNRLYLQYIGEMTATIIRVATIVSLFSMFAPHVWYPTFAGLAVIPVTVGWSLYNKNKYLPSLRTDWKKFSLAKLKELLPSGIWRSLQSAGEILLTGLDLLICNLFINPTAMGVLALSKMLPSLVQQLNWQMATAFAPKNMINYAKGETDVILKDLKRSFKIMSVIGTIPLGGLIVFGKEFFSLWVPSQDAVQLHLLSILACFWIALVAGIHPIGNIFLTINKVKPQAISVIISGVLNTIIVLTVLKFTDYGIYAIAGTSVVIGLARNLCYTIPAAARYLGFKWNEFFIGVMYSAIMTAAVVIIGLAVRYFIMPRSWIIFLLSCILTAVLSLGFGFMAILNKQERSVLFVAMCGVVQKVKR